MEILLFWLIFAVVVGVLASNKGRSGVGWFLFSILLSPLIGLIVVLVLSDKKKDQAAAEDMKNRRPCPRCGEKIAYSASVCRFCQSEVTPIGMSRPNEEASQGIAAIRDVLGRKR